MARDYCRDAGASMSSRSRQGFTILGDLIAILVFCLCALILFAFLYKPLVDKMIDEKATQPINSLEILPVYSDAQYVAIGLAQTRPESGSGGAQSATFSGVVRRIAESRSTLTSERDVASFIAASGYDETLERTFGTDSPFWEESAYYRADGTLVRERERVIVVLYHEGAWLVATCREFVRGEGLVNRGNGCELMRSGGIGMTLEERNALGVGGWEAQQYSGSTKRDPDTDIRIPTFGSVIEPGSVHVPSSNGAATLFVFIEREERK